MQLHVISEAGKLAVLHLNLNSSIEVPDPTALGVVSEQENNDANAPPFLNEFIKDETPKSIFAIFFSPFPITIKILKDEEVFFTSTAFASYRLSSSL